MTLPTVPRWLRVVTFYVFEIQTGVRYAHSRLPGSFSAANEKETNSQPNMNSFFESCKARARKGERR